MSVKEKTICYIFSIYYLEYMKHSINCSNFRSCDIIPITSIRVESFYKHRKLPSAYDKVETQVYESYIRFSSFLGFVINLTSTVEDIIKNAVTNFDSRIGKRFPFIYSITVTHKTPTDPQ